MTTQSTVEQAIAVLEAQGYEAEDSGDALAILRSVPTRRKVTIHTVVWDLDNSGTEVTVYATREQAEAAMLSFWQGQLDERYHAEFIEEARAATTWDAFIDIIGGDTEVLSNEDWLTSDEHEIEVTV